MDSFATIDVSSVFSPAKLHEYPRFRDIVRVIADGFDDNMPNVLMFGSSKGIPHAVLWDAAVIAKFGSFHRNQCVWNKLWTYHETPFFFDIDLAHPSQPKDIASLSDFLKEIVVHTCMHASRHVFFLRNVDVATGTKNGSSMLRVILERYASTAWFVCSTYKLGGLEPPIRSRFFTLRVPQPSLEDVERILACLGRELPEECRDHNITNLSLVLFLTNIKPMQDKLPHTTEEICKYHAPFLVNSLISCNMQPSIDDIRGLTQKLIAHGYTFSEVTSDLLAIAAIRPTKIPSFIRTVAQIDHMCALTERYRKSLFMECLLVHALFDGETLPIMQLSI